MNEVSFTRYFRLRPGRIECDAGGLWVGGIALLARGVRGAWTRRDERDLNRELSKLYRFPLDFARMRRGVDAVAGALESGDLARAQSSALLLQLPDPPESAGSQPGVLERQRLHLKRPDVAAHAIIGDGPRHAQVVDQIVAPLSGEAGDPARR